VSVAENAAFEAGLKVTLMVQFAPAARLVPQVVVSLKSAVPLSETDEIETAVLPALVTVTDCAALVVPKVTEPKAREVALSETCEAPVPVRATDSATPPAVKVIAAEAAPIAVGVKVTTTVHAPPAAREAPQVVVSVNSAAFVPVIASEARATDAVELALVRVRV
jgi:hypothetical protein